MPITTLICRWTGRTQNSTWKRDSRFNGSLKGSASKSSFLLLAGHLLQCSLLLLTCCALGWSGSRVEAAPAGAAWSSEVQRVQTRFREDVRPILDRHCFRCHDEQKKKGEVRLDLVSGELVGKEPFLLRKMLDQLTEAAMPPEDEPQPSEEERRVLAVWLKHALETTLRRPEEKNGSIRRLTVAQFQNTLSDLLGIGEDLTGILPPDSISRDGFLNNEKTMLLTPDFLESYLTVAEKALGLGLADASTKPVLQRFRIQFGKATNTNPCPDKLTLNGGDILPNADLIVTEPRPPKAFPFDFFQMPTELQFVEGYDGNSTVRGWRTFKGVYHSVFGVRIGSGGEMIPEGYLLKSATSGYENGKPIPWGPTPALNVVSRRLPNQGRFRITVEAARYHDPGAMTNRAPQLGVYLGVRRDCGLTMRRIGNAQPVESDRLQRYTFEGSMGDFPNPEVEPGNVNYLAGLREIGVRSEYSDGRSVPRMLVGTVEFEGPLHESWPPASYQKVFFESATHDESTYARAVIEQFATRAFRRPVTHEEMTALYAAWKDSFAASGDFVRSVKDVLLITMTSPQFLFLIEDSPSPQLEPLESYELASKLSYFLWNGPPDLPLLDRAAKKTLKESLKSEVTRMVSDTKFERFIEAFASQWLSLDKFDVVEVDPRRFGKLSAHVRRELRQEPIQFLKHLFRENRPVRELVQADYIVANDVVADYYGMGSKIEQGFQFAPVQHGDERLGGILTQAAILAGLSNGQEPNPVKRGAWIARKIIAEPPDDPPPNVPALPAKGFEQLSLREKLEQHRDQKGCRECHAKIDPYGLPLEEYDAGGRFNRKEATQTRSRLPDSTEIADTRALKAFLATDRIDQVAFSVLKHLATYATGRSLGYHEIEYLRSEGKKLRNDDYRMGDLIHLVVTSPVFLDK